MKNKKQKTLKYDITVEKVGKKAEQEAEKKKGEEILKISRTIHNNKNQKETILIIDEQGASKLEN